jgi:hypothetical protein
MLWRKRCAVLLSTLVVAPGSLWAQAGGETAVAAPAAATVAAPGEGAPGVEASAPIPVAATVSLAAPSLVLEVLIANDPDFPAVTPETAQKILGAAKATLADKFSGVEVEFRIIGSTTVTEFIRRNVPPGDACSQQFEPQRVRLGKRRARDVDPALVDRFLNRWTLTALKEFFPAAQRTGLTSIEALRTRLLEEFDRKVDLIAGFELQSGTSLLAADKLDERSYVSWVCAMRNQNEADFVLTNEFILYDLASEPYPHSIFAKCKMGGASLLSPRRRAIYRRALVASTFSMVTDLPFFQEEGVEWLTSSERLEVIGAFIVAHELGHALFKIPDFYDHPPECLMTTKFETGYVSGFRELVAHPGACPRCQVYVDAKRHVFLAEAAQREGRWDDAIKHLKVAIQKTPKHVDGSYVRYVADLSVQVAQVYVAKGDAAQASRWTQAALRIVPDHEEAVALKKQLAAGAR